MTNGLGGGGLGGGVGGGGLCGGLGGGGLGGGTGGGGLGGGLGGGGLGGWLKQFSDQLWYMLTVHRSAVTSGGLVYTARQSPYTVPVYVSLRMMRWSAQL